MRILVVNPALVRLHSLGACEQDRLTNLVRLRALGHEVYLLTGWMPYQQPDEVRAFYAARGLEPASLAALVTLVERGDITTQAGREVLAKLAEEGGDPAEIVAREGLAKVGDSGELEAIVAAAIEADPDAAEKLRAGNMKAIGPLVGHVMRETRGRADGGEVTRLIRSQLGL